MPSNWPGSDLARLLLRENASAFDTKLFDELCRIAIQVAQPVVRTALFREYEETTKTAATAWLSEAMKALQGILADPNELEGCDKEELHSELSAAFQGDILPPDEEEVREHARDLARMMISAWLEILRGVPYGNSHAEPVELTSDLLPSKERIQPELWRAFEDITAPFAVNATEAAQIRTDVGKQIFSGSQNTVALPFNICLRAEGTFHQNGRLVAMPQTNDHESRLHIIEETFNLFALLPRPLRDQVDLTDTAIDYRAQKYQKMLANLQGHILKGHGRDYSIHLFIRFSAAPGMVREWVRSFTDRYVTSAKQQLKEVEEFNKYNIPGRLFGSLFLSAKGYEALGFTQEDVSSSFQEKHAVINGKEVAPIKFRDGMAFYQSELNDPLLTTWEAPYRERQIDAMILLADDDEGLLRRQARAVLDEVEGVADVLAVEHGHVMRNSADESIEHFGYVNGRSQPLFLRTDLEAETTGGGIDQWDPSAPLGLVLVPDPYVDTEDCFGSYLVFRKLEQNVWGFKKREKELADALGLTAMEVERAAALIVGRFEDGTPIILSATEKMAKPVPNNFDYRYDPVGTRCPFHAHIRKVNPRGDTGSLEEERSHRIVRRGIPYGRRAVEPKDDPPLDQMPRDGVGLLFMCFQSSIANQFAFLQRIWASNPDFVKPETGHDPIIGQRASGEDVGAQQWPVAWGSPGTKSFNFEGYVTLKGGEFFFAPSIPFLKNL